MKTEREMFEETLSRIGKTDESTFDKYEDGSYKMDIIHFGWKMWQSSASREEYKRIPVEPKPELLEAIVKGFRYVWDDTHFSPEEAYKALIEVL